MFAALRAALAIKNCMTCRALLAEAEDPIAPGPGRPAWWCSQQCADDYIVVDAW